MADAELNWPKRGDRLFRDDLPDWQHTGVAGQTFDDITGWCRCVDGYREAANRVVESALARDARGMFDVLIYPVVFLYRHHVELALKIIIRLGGRLYDQEQPTPGHHHLIPLWQKARAVLERRWGKGEESVDATEALIGELDAFDPASFSFRYPETKTGEASLPEPLAANLRHLAVTANSMGAFLDSCIYGLWDDLDDKQTFLADMREMYGGEVW